MVISLTGFKIWLYINNLNIMATLVCYIHVTVASVIFYGSLRFLLFYRTNYSRSWTSWLWHDLHGPRCLFSTPWKVKLYNSKKKYFLRQFFEIKSTYFVSSLWANPFREVNIVLNHWDSCNKKIQASDWFHCI